MANTVIIRPDQLGGVDIRIEHRGSIFAQPQATENELRVTVARFARTLGLGAYNIRPFEIGLRFELGTGQTFVAFFEADVAVEG